MNLIITVFIVCIVNSHCRLQSPDPWDLPESESEFKYLGQTTVKNSEISSLKAQPSSSDWFFKRLLSFMIRGSSVKHEINEDKIEVLVNLKITKERYKAMEDFINSNEKITDQMYRRIIGNIEDSMHKESLLEIIVFTWSERLCNFLQYYKTELLWITSTISILIGANIIRKHMSRNVMIGFGFTLTYIYQAFVSYKEVEQKEYQKMVSALNACQWYFWTSKCDLPDIDPLLMLKHMHPIKILLRLITEIVTEPMMSINSTVNQMISNFTDEMWYPMKVIIQLGLTLTINVSLILLLVMIVFNFILNIPFQFNFLAGLLSFGIGQRRRTIFSNQQENFTLDNKDKISGQNLDKLLNVCNQAITRNSVLLQRNISYIESNHVKHTGGLKKSASAGRLTDFVQNSLEPKELLFERGAGDYVRRRC